MVTPVPTLAALSTPIQPVPSWLFTMSLELAPRTRLWMVLLMLVPCPSRVTVAEEATVNALLTCAALL